METIHLYTSFESINIGRMIVLLSNVAKNGGKEVVMSQKLNCSKTRIV